MIPAVVPHLHKPDPALHEPTGGEHATTGFGIAVGITGDLVFLGKIKGISGRGLHFEGQFKGLDACLEIGFLLQLRLMLLVQRLEQVQLLALFLEVVAVILNVGDSPLHVGFRARDKGSLEGPRQEGTTPVLGATKTAAQHDIAGQVLVFRAEAVQHP